LLRFRQHKYPIARVKHKWIGEVKRLGERDTLEAPVDEIRALGYTDLTAVRLCIEQFKEKLP
jgi:hypothetical protein